MSGQVVGRAAEVRAARVRGHGPRPRGMNGHGVALAWHAPPHLAMLVVMVLVMAAGTATAHLAGGGVLLLLALVLAPFARTRRVLQPVLLDLGAMAIVLVTLVMTAPAGSGHAHGGGLGGAALAILLGAGWLAARMLCTRGAVAVGSAVLSAAGLTAMTLPALG